MLLTYFALSHALVYTSDPFAAAGRRPSSPGRHYSLDTPAGYTPENGTTLAAAAPEMAQIGEAKADGAQPGSERLIHRAIKHSGGDSMFSSEMADNMELRSGAGLKTVEKRAVKTDIENIKTILEKEMEELSPEVNGQIASSIKSSKVDRSKYRDIFVIKKRIISDGAHKIVTFDIKERIIPKLVEYTLNKDPYTKALFVCILILLLSLVLTTTMKVYQTVFADRFSHEIRKSGIGM